VFSLFLGHLDETSCDLAPTLDYGFWRRWCMPGQKSNILKELIGNIKADFSFVWRAKTARERSIDFEKPFRIDANDGDVMRTSFEALQGISDLMVDAGRERDFARYFLACVLTIEPDKKRRYVARIQGVECLDDQQAEDALKVFKQRGWLGKMQKEILAVGGDASALGNARWAKHVLNVRFRLENVTSYPPDEYAAADDPVQKFTRYMLYKDSNIGHPSKTAATPKPSGSPEFPIPKSFMRRGTAAVECTPEHSRMQAKLMQELQAEYPHEAVVREKDCIDVIVCTNTELLLFEIKSDLEPRTVIRQALGQIRARTGEAGARLPSMSSHLPRARRRR